MDLNIDRLIGMLIGAAIGFLFWFLTGLAIIVIWFLFSGGMDDSVYAMLFIGYLPCALIGAYAGWRAA